MNIFRASSDTLSHNNGKTKSADILYYNHYSTTRKNLYQPHSPLDLYKDTVGVHCSEQQSYSRNIISRLSVVKLPALRAAERRHPPFSLLHNAGGWRCCIKTVSRGFGLRRWRSCRASVGASGTGGRTPERCGCCTGNARQRAKKDQTSA